MGLVRASRSGGSHDPRAFPGDLGAGRGRTSTPSLRVWCPWPRGHHHLRGTAPGFRSAENRRRRLGVGRVRMEGVIPLDLGRPGLLDRRRSSRRAC